MIKKTYKQAFEESYGEGSFNDDFLITATSAEVVYNKIKSAQGGYRKGSGRKKGIETKVISFRVPKDKAADYSLAISNFIKNL